LSGIMQISTSQFYNLNQQNMSSLSNQADTLQTQISTGKKLNAPSDDAVSYRRLQTIAQGTAADKAYTSNITLASSTLSVADTTLSSITNEIQNAQELAIKANSGSLSQSDRGVIADQLDSILQTLVGLANTKDSRGSAIFANDANAGVTANPDGTFTFATQGPATIPVSADSAVQPGESASRLFTDSSGGNILSTISALSAALRGTGDLSTIAGATGDALTASNNQVAAVQGSLGARAQRLDLESAHLTDVATDREVTRTALEDVDPTTAIADLQKTMTILQAAQASFTKLSSMSLFSMLS
jgi:flagellar hook-associated protein 3 FlgL